jgi:DNA-binding NtrC family response regulator
MARATILIVDDEQNMLATVQSILKDEGYNIVTARSGREALDKLEAQTVQLILSDARMPGELDGFKLLEAVRGKHASLPFVMVTAYATPRLAVKAIKAGATDYLAKPFEPEELLHTVAAILRGEMLADENRQLMDMVGHRYQVTDIIGETARIKQIRDLIRVTAPTDASVLILGESGTGKEMVASSLHAHSARAPKPFVSLNCAAIPENLLESELFGHEKGAFTGAVKQRIGRFEEADTGTIFLDEIGEMSPQLQTKLLRVLEERRFQRVGGNENVSVDVRVIAATNQNVREAIASGRLRSDLYHRLNVVEIFLPALRDRHDDIPVLAQHFLRQFSETMGRHIVGFTDDAAKLMVSYHWPGNIRELRNAVERAVIMETTRHIQPGSLPQAIGDAPPPAPREPSDEPLGLEDAMSQYERRFIERALRRHVGRINETAAELGITRHALRYRMQKLGMDVDEVFKQFAVK